VVGDDAKLLAVHELGEGSKALRLEEPGDGRFGGAALLGCSLFLVDLVDAWRSVRGASGEERFQRFFVSGE
jgi:hypothetical protein